MPDNPMFKDFPGVFRGQSIVGRDRLVDVWHYNDHLYLVWGNAEGAYHDIELYPRIIRNLPDSIFDAIKKFIGIQGVQP